MEQEGRPAARRERLWAFFELFALVGFVVAQPTLDVLGKAPDFFLFRRAGRAEILVLVLAVTVSRRSACGWPSRSPASPASGPAGCCTC